MYSPSAVARRAWVVWCVWHGGPAEPKPSPGPRPEYGHRTLIAIAIAIHTPIHIHTPNPSPSPTSLGPSAVLMRGGPYGGSSLRS